MAYLLIARAAGQDGAMGKAARGLSRRALLRTLILKGEWENLLYAVGGYKCALGPILRMHTAVFVQAVESGGRVFKKRFLPGLSPEG